MKIIIKLVISLVLLAILLFSAFYPPSFDIISPRLGLPAIHRVGASLEVVVERSFPYWGDGLSQWKVSLVQAQQITPLRIHRFNHGFSRDRIELILPDHLEDGPYHLRVQYGNQQSDFPKAVHIVEKFDRDLHFVQLADLPTFSGPGGKGDKLFKQIIDEINLINPAFILLTGDIAYGGRWQQYEYLMDYLEKLYAPVIAVPGNHEYEGWNGYLRHFKNTHHTVRYGEYLIVSLNSGHGRDQFTRSQFEWLQYALKKREGLRPIVQIHHPLLAEPGLRGYVKNRVPGLMGLFRLHNTAIVLSGHWHGDSVYDEQGRNRTDNEPISGIPYVVTTTAGADLRQQYSTSPLHHGYRLLRMRQGQLHNYTYDYDGDGERDVSSSIPVGQLNVKYDQSKQHAIIHNGLNEDLSKLRLILQAPGQQLAVTSSQGNIVKQQVRGDHTMYHIDIDVSANQDVSVRLNVDTDNICE